MLGTPTDWDMVSLGHGDTLCGHPQPARLFNKPPEIAKYGKSQPRLIIHAGLNWLEALAAGATAADAAINRPRPRGVPHGPPGR